MSNSGWLFIALLIANFLFQVEVFAKEDPLFEDSQDSQKTATNIKAEKITVTTQKPLTAASDLKLRQKDFDTLPRKTASDLMRLVPGLHITQHTGGAKAHQIFLRGFDTEHGQDLAGYLDGIPLNEVSQIHGNGYLDLHFLMPSVLSSMEVLKGPYLAKWGNFATAGSVNFIPSYQKNHIFSLGLAYGSFSSWQSHMEYCPHSEKDTQSTSYDWSGCINASFDDTRGYTQPGDQRSYKGSANFFVELEKSWYLKLNYNGYKVNSSAADILPVRLISNGSVNRFSALDESNQVNVMRHIFGFSLENKNPLTFMKLQGYANIKSTEIFSDFTFYTYNPEKGDQLLQLDKRWYAGVNSSYKRAFVLFNKLMHYETGIQYRLDQIQQKLANTEKRVSFNTIGDYDFWQHGLGAFVDWEVQLNPDWRWVWSLRHESSFYAGFGTQDRLSDIDIYTNSVLLEDDKAIEFRRYRQAILPKSSLIWAFTENQSGFLNFGSGSQPLTAAEAAWLQGNFSPMMVMAELGWRGDFIENSLLLSGAVWGAHKQQETVFDSEAGISLNKGSSGRIGLDLELRFKVSEWIFLSSNFNYTEAKFIKTNLSVPNMAKIITGHALVLGDLKVWQFAFSGRYLGERFHREGVYSRPYAIFNISSYYRWNRFSLHLDIENLFNTKWYDSVFYYASRPLKNGLLTEDFHVTAGTPLAIKLMLQITI